MFQHEYTANHAVEEMGHATKSRMSPLFAASAKKMRMRDARKKFGIGHEMW
jgi:hypothetical protein